MTGYETTKQTERAIILDRFLSRSQLSTLAGERDPDWSEERSVNFETEVDVQNKLSRNLEDTEALEKDLNSFDLEKPAFPWFLGEKYTVRWLDGGVEVTAEGRTREQEKKILEDVERFYDKHGVGILGPLINGVDMVSCILTDSYSAMLGLDEDMLSDLRRVTGVATSDRRGSRFCVAKEVTSVIKEKLDELRSEKGSGNPDAGILGDEETEDFEEASKITQRSLKVAKAYPNDSGRGIARLDPDTLLHLKLCPGDVVEVEGNDTTVAKVWRADRDDWNEDRVRMDGFTRQNADVCIGESVTVRKIEPPEGERIVLSPPEGASVRLDTDATDMIKRRTLKRPVREGDTVPIPSSAEHQLTRSSEQMVPLILEEAEPEGTVMMTEDTEIVLRE
jgi:hypothetical protein